MARTPVPLQRPKQTIMQLGPASVPVTASGPGALPTIAHRVAGALGSTGTGNATEALLGHPLDLVYADGKPPAPYAAPAAGAGAHDLVLGAGSPGSFSQLPVMQRQRVLRDAGFNVTIDGMPGPQTLTASKAYVKGIPASYWNHAWLANHPGLPAPTSVPGLGGPAASSSGPLDRAPSARVTTTAAPAASTNPLQQLLQMVLGGTSAYKVPTPAEMLTNAGKIADVGLAPYKAELERQQAQALADARGRAEFQGNLAQALAGVLKTQGPQTQSAYQEAGNNTAAFAKGYSGDLGAAALKNADETNSFLHSIGADPAQMIDPSKAAATANVAYGLGGFIPASTMAREGAAFTAAANLLPQTATGQGARLAADELRTGAADKAKLAQQLIDLQLQRPKLVQDALAQQQDFAIKGQAASQNQALLPLLLAKDFENFPGTNPLTGTKTKTQVGIDLQVGSQTIRLQQLDLTTRRTLAQLTGVDPTTGAPTPETQRLLLAEWKAKNPAAKGGFTKHQLQQLQATAADSATEAFQGWTDKDGTFHPPVSYQQAMSDLLAHGVPLSVAQKALNAHWTRAGFDAQRDDHNGTFNAWVPSDVGRPKQPYQVRVRARGK